MLGTTLCMKSPQHLLGQMIRPNMSHNCTLKIDSRTLCATVTSYIPQLHLQRIQSCLGIHYSLVQQQVDRVGIKECMRCWLQLKNCIWTRAGYMPRYLVRPARPPAAEYPQLAKIRKIKWNQSREAIHTTLILIMDNIQCFLILFSYGVVVTTTIHK